MKEKLDWALQCFSVFSAAISSLERPGGGWSVWGWSAGSTGHCVGRGSASASPDCPWFVPFPAHSYVIICDKLLCSQATNPHVRGLAYWTTLRKPHAHRALKIHERVCAHTHTHTHTHTHIEAPKCAFLHTYSHFDSHKTKLWAPVTSGFCILEPKDGGYNPGSHIDTQKSSADFSGSCRVQHFPLSTLSSSKSPWQRTCWYSLLCQNRHNKNYCLCFLALNNFD